MPNCIDVKDLNDDVEYWRKATDYWCKEYFKLDFKYQKCYKICFELASLKDRIEQAKFFNQREWRELWQDKLKEVQDRDIESANKFYDALLKIIDDMPVKHGRWEDYYAGDSWKGLICTVCKKKCVCELDYCPNCGAKMDGDI